MDIKSRGTKKTKELTGYCMTCKSNGRTILKPVKETMKNGRLAAKGTCGVCGGKMFKFLPNES